MEKYYAQAIIESLRRGMDPKEVASRLRSVLQEAHKESLLPRIARSLSTQQRMMKASGTTEIVIAKEADEKEAKEAAEEFIKKEELNPKSIGVRVDESLIGGWVLSTGSVRVDASFKKQLTEIYRNITR